MIERAVTMGRKIGLLSTFPPTLVSMPPEFPASVQVVPKLDEGAGMLFIFPNVSRQSMWMIRMKFPLDIVWLDENLVVVHITYGCAPCPSADQCPSYSSVKRVKYAIEMTAGAATTYGFEKDKQLAVTASA